MAMLSSEKVLGTKYSKKVCDLKITKAVMYIHYFYLNPLISSCNVGKSQRSSASSNICRTS